MLKLNLIVQNSAGEGVVTWFGIVSLALLAIVIAGLWVVVATGPARGESADDRGLKALRRRRLVVRSSRRPRGAQGAVVSELERAGESGPTGAAALPEAPPPGG
jgi:hypothetical protein